MIGRVWENQSLVSGEGVERKENGGQVLEKMTHECCVSFLKERDWSGRTMNGKRQRGARKMLLSPIPSLKVDRRWGRGKQECYREMVHSNCDEEIR